MSIVNITFIQVSSPLAGKALSRHMKEQARAAHRRLVDVFVHQWPQLSRAEVSKRLNEMTGLFNRTRPHSPYEGMSVEEAAAARKEALHGSR